MKRLFKVILFACIALYLLFVCGCQSKDKSQSFMTTEYISENATLEYDSVKDETLVVWDTTLRNDTIYDFHSFKVQFELFSYGESVGEKIYTYELGVKQGQSYSGRFNFVAQGEITDIEFVEWQALYSSVWDTYTALFVITIIFVVLAVLSYGVMVFYNCLELASFDFDDFKEAGGLYWAGIFLGLPTILMLGFFFSPNWVFSLTFFIALVAIAISMFVVHCFHCFVEGFIEGWNEGKSKNQPTYRAPTPSTDVEQVTSKVVSNPSSESKATTEKYSGNDSEDTTITAPASYTKSTK
ncbi:MAG: hypothetical protein IJ400_04600 [Clostridia bacterium]|nr:hypothetical protein [Clostridia bacterium]